MEEQQSEQELWDQELANTQTDQPATKPTVVDPPVATEQATDVVKTAEAAKPTTEELLTQALARVEKLEGRTRNVEGHIGGLTSQQKVLNETFAAARSAAAEVKDAPTQAQIKQAIANPEQWDRLKEDFPEWSDATETYIDHKLKGITPGADVETVNRLVSQAVSAASVQITQEVEAKIIDKSLNAVFPGWRKEQPEIQAWVQTQSPEVKAWALSNEVEDAASLLSLWYDAKKSNPAQQILDQRKQKLNQAVAAPRGTRPAPTKTPDQMSPDELWAYEAKLRERARAAA